MSDEDLFWTMISIIVFGVAVCISLLVMGG